MHDPQPFHGSPPAASSRTPAASSRTPPDERAAWWPRWVPSAIATTHPTVWSVVWTCVLALLCLFSSVVAWSFGVPLQDGAPAFGVTGILAMLVLPLLSWGVVVRKRYPVQLTLVASAIPLALPYDSLTALVALVTVVATRPWRTVVWCTVAAGAATAAATLRDAAGDPTDMIWTTTDPATGELSYPLPGTFVAIGVLSLAVAFGVGYALRVRRRAAVAEARSVTQEAATAVLRDRMNRQEERDLISREVHDTVAYALGQISLEASALEVGPHADDDEVAEAARRMRSASQKANSELRALLSLLRSGSEGGGSTFESLTTLLTNLREQGGLVSASIFVTDGQTAAPVLARAVYRIVQESMVNALKHAPGRPVDVTVRATPADGVSITVVNPTTPGAAIQTVGTGSGITGMRERADRIGGLLETRHVGGVFTVQAHLPWVRQEVTD
ncbi:signal transduction histidine kinase [Promicromonospora sp. AC04]|uniref:sensor histidine kinase n=1 Tax=Promicromonospora sp. AC04 TaxID=2135723 RepID=UPI000D425598|nr:histidine kinase [Promicromonospora sp. AC04]PUB21476.1 signal transduction histidine kinase [Promicromonospora sp. AC04]